MSLGAVARSRTKWSRKMRVRSLSLRRAASTPRKCVRPCPPLPPPASLVRSLPCPLELSSFPPPLTPSAQVRLQDRAQRVHRMHRRDLLPAAHQGGGAESGRVRGGPARARPGAARHNMSTPSRRSRASTLSLFEFKLSQSRIPRHSKVLRSSKEASEFNNLHAFKVLGHFCRTMSLGQND